MNEVELIKNVNVWCFFPCIVILCIYSYMDITHATNTMQVNKKTSTITWQLHAYKTEEYQHYRTYSTIKHVYFRGQRGRRGWRGI